MFLLSTPLCHSSNPSLYLQWASQSLQIELRRWCDQNGNHFSRFSDYHCCPPSILVYPPLHRNLWRISVIISLFNAICEWPSLSLSPSLCPDQLTIMSRDWASMSSATERAAVVVSLLCQRLGFPINPISDFDYYPSRCCLLAEEDPLFRQWPLCCCSTSAAAATKPLRAALKCSPH